MHSKTRGGPQSPQNTRQGRFGAAKKYLGQHFLIDPDVLATIIQTADLEPTDRVLEIGPGHGVLTSALAEALPSGLVVALEKDYDLIEELRSKFGKRKNVKIASGDVLALPMSQLIPIDVSLPDLSTSGTDGAVSDAQDDDRTNVTHSENGTYKVVANIPYSITSPIITKFLLGDYRGRAGEVSPRPQSLTLLVQKEVAERLVAEPPSRERGILTVLIELFGRAQLICVVPPQAFDPPPKVESAVIHIRLEEPKANPQTFHRLLKFGFANKRRQLHNSLAGSLGLSSDRVLTLLEKASINPLLRAEQLPLEAWLRLHDVVLKELL